MAVRRSARPPPHDGYSATPARPALCRRGSGPGIQQRPEGFRGERLGPGVVQDAAGYRDYPPGAIRRLAFIRTAQACGLTLADIRGVLAIRDSGQPPCAHVTELISGHLEQIDSRLAELQQAQAALRELARRAGKTAPATCTSDDICRILTGMH